MPILSAEIPQNPLPYQRNNFVNAEVMDEATTEIQELLANPTMEEGLPPHLVAEFHFTRFQTPQLHIGLVRFHQKMDTRMFKFRGAAPELVEGNFQAQGLTTLEGPELCSVNCAVHPFQIRPCETRVRSMHLTNLFMYRKETIAAAYEGAGWTFSTKIYRHTPPVCVHHQGFEIIRRAHFPPTLVSSQLLESSLEPNWLPPTDVMADEWEFVKRSDAPYQSEWNEAFDSYHRSIFRRDPAYKSQHRLQCLSKSTQSQDELDTIYEGLAERPR